MTNKKKKQFDDAANEFLALYLGCGVAIGGGLGAALSNIGLGMSVGMAVGVAIWAGKTNLEKKK